MTESQAMSFDIKGIKCDNPDCDYQDMEAEFDPEKFLNMPCPECGSNLFTPEDYRTMKIMLGAADIVNEMFADVDLSGDKSHRLEIKMDGSGVPSMTVDTNVDEKTTTF